MNFRLRYIVKSLGGVGETLIRFEMKTSELVSVELRRLADTEIDKHYIKGDILCTAMLQTTPTHKISHWLAKPEEPQPPGFTDFANEAHNALSHAAVRAVKLWRWRIGYRGDRNPIRFFKSFEWSINGTDWTPGPHGIHLHLSAGIPFAKITDEIVESVLSLSRRDTQEPLAHELFQEAWSQRMDNPRSSLVMGIAAAETGVKRLISTLVPAADWLVQETQSPPLVRMLEEYLPTLPVRLRINGNVLCPPTWLIDVIKKGVGLRNKIVHGHDIPLKSDSLRDVLEAVHDLLYLFDLYAGYEWAVRHLSVRMQSSLAKET
jgi:hypothetical protein